MNKNVVLVTSLRQQQGNNYRLGDVGSFLQSCHYRLICLSTLRCQAMRFYKFLGNSHNHIPYATSRGIRGNPNS